MSTATLPKIKKEPQVYCKECEKNVPITPLQYNFGVACGVCGSNRVTRAKD